MSVIVTALLLLFIERNCRALMHDRISSSVFVANLVRALRSTFTWFNLHTSSSREVSLLLSIPLKYRIRVCSRSSRSAGTYGSLQIHIIGRTRGPRIFPFFLRLSSFVGFVAVMTIYKCYSCNDVAKNGLPFIRKSTEAL